MKSIPVSNRDFAIVDLPESLMSMIVVFMSGFVAMAARRLVGRLYFFACFSLGLGAGIYIFTWR